MMWPKFGNFFKGWFWFKLNNLRDLENLQQFGKRVKLKGGKFWELIFAFGEVTGEKLVGGLHPEKI